MEIDSGGLTPQFDLQIHEFSLRHPSGVTHTPAAVLAWDTKMPWDAAPSPDDISDQALAAVHEWILSGKEWPARKDGHLYLPK